LGGFGLGRSECRESERSGFNALLLEERAGFSEIHFFRGVVRLAKAVAESGDEVRALSHQDDWLILFKRERDERRPTGVDAKAEGGGLHGTSMGRK
jgi:hypothetical protein